MSKPSSTEGKRIPSNTLDGYAPAMTPSERHVYAEIDERMVSNIIPINMCGVALPWLHNIHFHGNAPPVTFFATSSETKFSSFHKFFTPIPSPSVIFLTLSSIFLQVI